MRFRVDPNAAVPLCVQIASQVRLAIAAGRLSEGDRLPSARDLAAELRVNFHTVRRAYGDLEKDGVLRVERGRGTTVGACRALTSSDLRDLVRRHVERLVEDVAGADVDPAHLRQVVDDELRRLLSPTESPR